MFTDSPVTPCRLEILIDVLRDFSRREWNKSDLTSVLQPKGLADVTPNSDQAKQTVAAAKELGIFTESADGMRLTVGTKGHSTRDSLLLLLDEKVASRIEIEPYYAPFYSYLLHKEKDESRPINGDDWAIHFNRECTRFARSDNPFNKTKYTGLHRWYDYSGHGWFDMEEVFQPNPYGRVKRSLPRIFETTGMLSADEFFARLSLLCPELDGGKIFLDAAPPLYDPSLKQLSSGLSHALVDLHEDRIIRLHCTADSRGWSVEAAQPPIDAEFMRSSRIDHVEYAK